MMLRWRRRNLVKSGVSRHPAGTPASALGIALTRVLGILIVIIGLAIGGSALLGLGAFA
jgi:hypothetical protein